MNELNDLAKRTRIFSNITQQLYEEQPVPTFIIEPDPRNIRYQYLEHLQTLETPAERIAYVASLDICIQHGESTDFSHRDMAAEYARAVYPVLVEVDAHCPEYGVLREKLMRWLLFARWDNTPHDVRYAVWLCAMVLIEKRPASSFRRAGDVIDVGEYPQANIASELQALTLAWPTTHFTPALETFVTHLRRRYADLVCYGSSSNYMYNQIGSTEEQNGVYCVTDDWARRQMYIFSDLNRLFRFLQAIRTAYPAAPRFSTPEHIFTYKKWLQSALGRNTRQVVNETYLQLLYHQLIGPGDTDIFRETEAPERPTKGGMTSMVPYMDPAWMFGRQYGSDNTKLRRDWISVANVMKAETKLPRGGACRQHAEIRLFEVNHNIQTSVLLYKFFFLYTFHAPEIPLHYKTSIPKIIRAGGTFFMIASDGYVESHEFGVVAAEWSARMRSLHPETHERWWNDVFVVGESAFTISREDQ